TIAVASTDASGNTTTVSRSVSVDSVPPTADITYPSDGAAVGGSLLIAGTANDANFKEYALRFGPGENPTAWGVITATSTTPVDASTLGTWNTSNLFGTYTIRLNVTDTFGNGAEKTRVVNVGNACTLSGTITKGQWKMLSLPGKPLDPVPSSFLGTSRYETQRWDPAMEVSDPHLYNYKRSFLIDDAGIGFWVKPYEQDITYNVPSWIPDTTAEFEIHLYEGWNQIGVPFNREMAWDLVSVRSSATGEEKGMAEAVTAGWIDGSFYGYASGGYVQKGTGNSMSPYEGYFVRAYTGVDLLVDPGAGLPGGIAALIVRPRYDWKIQVSAETRTANDTDNFAGIMKGADDEFDAFDSGEPPVVSPYVSVYFNNENWQRNAGRFTSDIRSGTAPAMEGGQTLEKEWKFTVQTDTGDNTVRLRLYNAATSPPSSAETLPANYGITVRDTVTGEEFDPRTKPEYTFTYRDGEGGKREFILKAVRLAAAREEDRTLSLPAGWNLIAVPLEPENTDVRAQLGDDLNDIVVFQYYEREMYNPESPEHVDVQAGIGYWIYLEAPATVDFRGAPTNTSTPVGVPLAKGWNLIGNPYETQIVFGDNILVTKDGETLALGAAVRRGWLAVPMYTYENGTGDYAKIDAGGVLAPWRGYIIKALERCEITIAP
ncbi:MAG: hypothetical protein AB1742_01695, partial [bacterium]